MDVQMPIMDGYEGKVPRTNVRLVANQDQQHGSSGKIARQMFVVCS